MSYEAEDPSKSNDELATFTGNLDSILRGAFASQSLSLGMRLGLFDVLHKHTNAENPKTSQQIADVTNFRERYVREWLCAMAAAGLVECDDAGERFWLAKGATEVIASNIFAVILPDISRDLTNIQETIESCFKKDGPPGTFYSQYPNFHRALDAKAEVVLSQHLVPKILPSVLNSSDVGSLLERLRDPSVRLTCLDIGCSFGVAIGAMDNAFPVNEFHGIDLDDTAIREAEKRFRDRNNIHFHCGDAGKMVDTHPEWIDKFDFVTMLNAMHDQAYPDQCLRGLVHMIRPGGVLVCSDNAGSSNVAVDRREQPVTAAICYSISLFHCMPVSLVHPGGRGDGSMWGIPRALQLMKECGLHNVKVNRLPQDTTNVYYVWKKE